MKRRRFLYDGALAAAGIFAARAAAHGAALGGPGRRPPAYGADAGAARRPHARGMERPLVLRGGVLYDGLGGPPREAAIRVEGGRIVAVGAVDDSGAEILDVRGLAVAPGFIDIHSHSDRVLADHPRAESKVRQGVTTEVGGQDGSSAPDLPGLFRRVAEGGAAVNLASMVGAGTIRGRVVGAADRQATEVELARMVEEVQAALAAGAVGLSSGLEYTPGGFADLEELVALARPLAARGLPYATHMRNEDDRLLGAIEEALNVGRLAGVPVQISHLKAQGERNWWKAEPALDLLEAARADGIDVLFDRYPYVAYSTGLANMFPLWTRDGGTDAFLARLADPALAPRIRRAVVDKVDQLGSWDSVQVTGTASDALAWARGRRLGSLAAERAVDPFELLVHIVREDRNRAGMVGFGMSEENTTRMLAHPLGMICSDGSALATSGPLSAGTPHPRNFGSFPRVLGHYSRDRGAIPLETAIHKMTAMPADRLRLSDRGRVAPGAHADLVVFDPATVRDRATFEQPHHYPEGIFHVAVNGVLVIRDGEHTGALPGRPLSPVVLP